MSDAVVDRLTDERFDRRHRSTARGAADWEAQQQGLELRQEVTELTEVKSPADVAGHLGIDEDTVVFVRRRRLTVDETPVQIAHSFYPLDVAVDAVRAADTGAGGSYARIEEAGHALTRLDEAHHARPATVDERDALGLDDDEPVVELHRTAFAGDRPVEHFVGIMPASRHRFTGTVDLS